MRLLEAAKWLFRVKRLSDALTEEKKMYDLKKSLAKGLQSAGRVLGAAALAAVVGVLADPESVTAILDGVASGKLVAAAVPVIVGLAHMAQDWLKHKDDKASEERA